MQDIQKVCDFLKQCKVYFLATENGDQPRVRPFATVNIFENKLYIQTGKVKNVFKQMKSNPKVEICGLSGDKWIRVDAKAVEDDNLAASESMLDAYPELKKQYKADDGNTVVLYLKDGTATIFSSTGKPEVLKF
jgi:uncharacterized pyridoxamine 5'-phosphate oxidase family protein